MDTATPGQVATASYSNQQTNGLHAADNDEDDNDCRPSKYYDTTRTLSDRFLHSDETLEECYESTDDDEDDNESCCQQDEEEELLDDEDDEEFRRRAEAFQKQQRGDMLRGDSKHDLKNSVKQQQQPSKKKKKKKKHHPKWARRQLYRSVSVDDLMEYQREFSLADVGRASSAHDLTDYQREFQALLEGYQPSQATTKQPTDHDTPQPQQSSSTTDNTDTTTTTATTPATISLALALSSSAAAHANNSVVGRRKVGRNSIANSDLAEFKRQFCQDRAAKQVHDETLVGHDLHHHHTPIAVDSQALTAKLNSLEKDYQWGTRSLRRAILASDLGKFERSVRTVLLESSRENSADSLVDDDEDDADNDNDDEDDDDDDTITPMHPIARSGSSLLAINHRDSLLKAGAAHESSSNKEEGDDWGTRSLRKSLKELDFNESHQQHHHHHHHHHHHSTTSSSPSSSSSSFASGASPATSALSTYSNSSSSVSRTKLVNRSQNFEPVKEEEEEIELPLEAPLGSSPWNDDKLNSSSSNGLKMPRRVTSSESTQGDDAKHSNDANHSNNNNHDHYYNSNNKTIPRPISPPPLPQNRSSSLNDIGMISSPPLSDSAAMASSPDGQLEFEWQMRSRFRRSISSSDIEKYQRHLEAAMEEDSERFTENDDDNNNAAIAKKIFDPAIPALASARLPSLPIAAAASAAVNNNNSNDVSGSNQLHPLLKPSSWHSSDDKNATCQRNNSDDAIPKKPRRERKSRRRHRRSTSDEPELHMENVISDVAPRKPTRTTSRPISPPPPRPVMVRFADNFNQVVEIPKVSEEMKPYLFYTKRDVKRFRMNEHRRQEEQIRSYMKYLNQKENALDASPCLYE